MSKEVEYYTAQEFADLAGVSKQAVYQRVKKDLAAYTVKRDGITLISAEALPQVGVKGKVDQPEQVKFAEEKTEVEQAVIQEDGKLIQEVDKEVKKESKVEQAEQPYASGDSKLLEYLIKENARLIQELEKKDSLIAEKDAAIADFASRFASIAEKEQDISSHALATAGQAQMLHAMSEADGIEAPVEEVPKKRHWWQKK